MANKHGIQWLREHKGEVKTALRNNRGLLKSAAAELDCYRQSLQQFLKQEQDVKEVADDVREGLYDEVENTMINKALKGDKTMLIWFSKTQMRHRGYEERPQYAPHERSQITINLSVNDGRETETSELVDAEPLEELLPGEGVAGETGETVEPDRETDG